MGRSLHIAVLSNLDTHWLLPRLNRFLHEHPDITVNLSTRTLPFKFSDHPFDAAIYHAAQLWPGTRGSALFAEEKRSEEHTSELQSRGHLVCRLLLEKK